MHLNHDSHRPLVVLILALALARLLIAGVSPITPQEAYYWSWTQFPGLSYFDHPPLASYSIALTTAVMGNTPFGIKLAAVLWSFGSNVLLAKLIIDMFADRRLAFWAVLALNLSLLYVFFGITITPDGPLLFGWIGTIWSVWRVRQSGQSKWWGFAGFFMGLAWLGKYPGVLLVGSVGLYLLLDPAMRRWLLRPQAYLAVLVSMVVFSPVLLWNMQQEWASLAFQSTRRVGQMNEFKPRFFLVLVITQTLLLTPYLTWLTLSGLGRNLRDVLKRRIPSPHLLLLVSAIPPLLIFTLASFRGNAKLNWLLPAWWSLMLLGLHHVLSAPKMPRSFKIGLSTSALMLGSGVAMLMLPNLPLGELNTWSGWREAAVRADAIADKERLAGRQAFVFSPNYKISSLMWFYRPSQQRTYAQDIFGIRALQYDYFPSPSDLKGQSGIFVLSDQGQSRGGIARIAPYFDKVELADVIETKSGERTVRRVELWLGQNYRGRPQSKAADNDPDSSESP